MSMSLSMTYVRIGRQLIHAARMLDDLEQGVTTSDAKLTTAMAKMRKFIPQTEGMPSFRNVAQCLLITFQRQSQAGALLSS